VIEGFVDPAEELIFEGPFGDHTGFYSLADYYPRFHVTCITHRRNAIYPATIVGIPPQEDGWIGKATERIFLSPIKMTVAPEVTDMHMPVEGVFHNITMVNIRKSFPGQALKIANAMWGAGQMMFNKILVVCDENVTLTKYLDLARNISRNCDPARDIHFSKGPVDVLDHASQRFAFGSKMVIDATEKYPEELSDPLVANHLNHSYPKGLSCEKELIMSRFPEISGINQDLPGQDVPVVIFAIAKQRPGHLREIAARIVRERMITGSGFFLFMDEMVNISDLAQVVWLAANNLDPSRDCFYPQNEDGTDFPVLCLDGTSKSGTYDNFSRNWPNVILMDEKTIHTIDEKWAHLNLGQFISSPSLRYRPLVKNSGAVASGE
jgi:4-hydroxy-3-polyprenylbenzoate decarboxylase